MPKNIRYTLLNYLPCFFEIEKEINQNRITILNNSQNNGNYIIYLVEREIRVKDNFALQYAISKSKELNLPLKIIHPKVYYSHKPKEIFINAQIKQTQNIFLKYSFDFEIYNGDILNYLKKLNPTLLILDFNPILNRFWVDLMPFKIIEIDGHNICPARFISHKQEYMASTIRRKIYREINQYLTEFDNFNNKKVEVDFALEDFIQNKLKFYAEFKNDPSKNITSKLSKYLNLGFISSQRVALEVIKADVDNTNKEVFLEELIIRKELADNFCLYADFKSFKNTPVWAKKSLDEHKFDYKKYLYSYNELKNAKTHDSLWNATQNELLKTGTMHPYLRMYWAKMLLKWTKTPEIALEYLIKLNDTYAYDAPSANGYAGILWSIASLHDKPFRDYFITGKIRRMNPKSIQKKFNLENYLIQHQISEI